MKLIKLSADHYVIVDDSEIKMGDYYWNEIDDAIRVNNAINHPYHKKITHSTQPLEYTTEDHLQWDKIKRLSLSEVKELIGEVDVEALSRKHHYNGTIEGGYLTGGFINGYNQALKDNKEKKYTEEDMRKMFDIGEGLSSINDNDDNKFRHALSLIHPETQWEVEFIDGKLKLL